MISRDRRYRRPLLRRADPVWMIAFLCSLGLNLVIAYGYAHTLGNGSWNKALVCPRECETPRVPVAFTIEEAEKARRLAMVDYEADKAKLARSSKPRGRGWTASPTAARCRPM